MPSFERIDYSLRPAKQVERKLIVETLQKLSKASYFICDYTYLGFGSIYYSDFLLFHKYLHIDDMICVEDKDVPNRMKFNKPFDFIKLHMKKFNDVIPLLDRKLKYMVWLDYDYSVHEDVFSDIQSLIHILVPGSIIIITVASDLERLITHSIPKSE
ncbi:MAG: hypothetical protein EHM20_15470, partial [Alphaproteobacteria bacterium]